MRLIWWKRPSQMVMRIRLSKMPGSFSVVSRMVSSAGSVGLSSPMSSPSANACRSSSVTFPSITASYTFETCDFGESSRWERAPSFVISSSPSVSLSSRPTGKRSFLAASLKRSSTVRSRRSSVAETTPAGLWSIQYSIFT